MVCFDRWLSRCCSDDADPFADLDNQAIKVRPFNLAKVNRMRSLEPEHIDTLVSIKGACCCRITAPGAALACLLIARSLRSAARCLPACRHGDAHYKCHP